MEGRDRVRARVNEFTTDRVVSFDGTGLAVHRMGQGRPVLLLHGLFSSAQMNWIKFGHAQRIAEAGFEAIMPDLRAHGDSDAPHEPEAYPHDVLVRDLRAIAEALALEDFDLAGFSLGARTAARAVIEGVEPRRLVFAGMGLEGLTGWNRRAAFFIDAIARFDEVKRGDPAFMAVSFMKTMKVDRVATRLLLGAIGDIEPEELGAIEVETLVVSGEDDRDNGSPQALVDALPNARFAEVPGTHMSSVTEPALGEAIASFLAA
jgi:pimeloyl-ACP methyl ester carboxylesterase